MELFIQSDKEQTCESNFSSISIISTYFVRHRVQRPRQRNLTKKNESTHYHPSCSCIISVARSYSKLSSAQSTYVYILKTISVRAGSRMLGDYIYILALCCNF